MARKPRWNLAGLPQHVIQRGNDRRPCFVDDSDRAHFLARLKHSSERHRVAVHAYVLMDNHVHLLATPAEPEGISRMMQSVSAPYTQSFNLRHGRTGTIWEGRFHGCLVDTDGYLWRCHRYIELNPVRAAMVQRPGDYRWSSYRRNARSEPDSVVTPHPLYLRLGDCDTSRALNYRGFFDQPQSELELNDLREHLQRECAFGEREFIAEIERRTGRLAGLRRPGRPRRAPFVTGQN